MKKTIVIGISGGIAAYKILDLIKLLQQKNLCVEVMMTHGATKIVDPEEIEKLTESKVFINIFENSIDYHAVIKSRTVDHIELAKKADLMIIAPATANMIAKIANGIADDYVTTTILAARSPVIICPSMNSFMWHNPITQQNIKKLHSAGYIILDPDSGFLACGDNGTGRLIDPTEIANEALRLINKSETLQGKKFIVTAGGTHEYIDGVRFIGNKSSGKMGAAIADAAYLRGAQVLHLRSVNSVESRYPTQEEVFETAEELENLLSQYVPEYDVCFHVAAVSDFKVKGQYIGKLPSDKETVITLQPRNKILNNIKKYNSNIQLIGFKAAWNVSDTELTNLAQEKLESSKADYIVANDVGKENQGFSVDTNEVVIVGANGKVQKIPFAAKRDIAEKLIDIIYL